MKSWRMMRAHRRLGRRLVQEVGELTLAVADPSAARELAGLVLADLATAAHTPTSREVAGAVVARCVDDAQRSGLAAYLHLCRDASFETLAEVFGVTAPAARRLVERGTGTTPVTAADECRGWALVAPRPSRTEQELQAASGHLALCRRCRYRLRAHAVLEHRVAAAGSAAFGASVAAAVGRAFATGHVGGATAGAITGPVVALSTAAALTAGVGAFAVTTHDVRPGVRNVSHHGPAQAPADQRAPAPATQPATPGTGAASGTPHVSPTPLPANAPARLAPLPGPSVVKLPVSPLPTASLPPLPVTASPLPVPLPTLTLPPLP